MPLTSLNLCNTKTKHCPHGPLIWIFEIYDNDEDSILNSIRVA
jgi:hypothetical protein